MSYACESTSHGLYRSRCGLIFGVCRGVADYFDISVFWTRLLVVIAFIFTGFWPVGAIYLLAALLMKRAPRYTNVKEAFSDAASRVRRTVDSLDTRLQNLETIVTDHARDWEKRLRG